MFQNMGKKSASVDLQHREEGTRPVGDPVELVLSCDRAEAEAKKRAANKSTSEPCLRTANSKRACNIARNSRGTKLG